MARNYAICNVENDLSKVDFSQVVQTDPNTVRRSLDDSQFVISYTLIPTFINDSTIIPSAILDQDQAVVLMHTEAWSEDEYV